MRLEYFQEQVLFATVRIDVADPATGESGIGTGFLLRHVVPGHPDYHLIFLATCRHCLLEGRGGIALRFHQADPANPRRPLLGHTLQTRHVPYRDAYCGHPDPEVDVAVINVSDALSKLPNVFFATIGTEQFADFAHPDLLPYTEVVFVGYPNGLYDQVHNLPILRSGRIASHPEVDFNGKPEFLIDAQVYPGSSGSPVFAPIGGEMRFLGMVGQVHTRAAAVEFVDVGRQPIVRDCIGLGVVYKPFAVLDVVKKIEGMALERLAVES